MLAACLCVACSDAQPGAKRLWSVDAPMTEQSEARTPEVQVGQAALPKVAFLGDGITAGMHVAAEQAFPAVLQRRLREVGSGFTLLNAGSGHGTSQDALRRVDALLKQRPVVVVIEIGENDAAEGIGLSETEANLRAIVAKVQSADAEALLLGLQVPKSHNGADYARDLAAIYPRVADDLHTAVVPDFMRAVAGRPELTLSDGLHPTPQGHERLAGNMAQALRTLLTAADP
jgi:acyl-CoA thioesterase-1